MPRKKLQKIKFVGGRRGEDAPEFLTDGSTRIILPKNQKRAFAHKDAQRILKAAPELYKPVVGK